MKPVAALLGAILGITFILSYAAEPRDGEYRARVRTESGTYRVPVIVEDGEVKAIRWPNGGRMRVRGAEIDDGEAVGRDSDGRRYRIEVEDLEYEPGDDE